LSHGLILNDRLDEISDLLDIRLEVRKEIELLYNTLATHLCRPESSLQEYDPKIYPQGSFRIQTVVKPFANTGDIDVDIVCELNIEKESISKADLKKLLGDELKLFKYENIRIKESGRCWTIFVGDKLHIDVLPSISNPENRPTGIYLTDRELHHWQTSDPIGYANWFIDINAKELGPPVGEFRKSEVEEFPEILPKLNLQKAVQILKRHRDIHFRAQPDLRPPSVLITTMMGYLDDPDERMFDKITHFAATAQSLVKIVDGKYVIKHPVDDHENFVDKWNDYPERKKAFDGWIEALSQNFLEIDKSGSVDRLDSFLNVAELKNQSYPVVSNAILKSIGATDIPTADSTAHMQKPMWPMLSTAVTVRVFGTIHKSQWGTKIGVYSPNFPVRKNNWIKFWVETNARPGYEVYWQVTNTGREARNENKLRGNIESHPSGRVHWESTQYRGTHFVVAHIVKDGQLLASSQPYKVLIA
jgi:hypothetical protein